MIEHVDGRERRRRAEEDVLYASWKWTRSGDLRGTWDLAKDATLRVRPGPTGAVIRAEAGLVLVTQTGDPVDHVLAQGEAAGFAPGGLVVAWALEPARLSVADGTAIERPSGYPPRRAPLAA